ncbi:MAG: cytidylate kinase-like family protein [Lachnospiraceae bacterium]|nr:cytidylate kinase-like family protein [Lachnospiraceae bacterium]
MMNRIITISREFGSGGRTIGKMTAERLGIPCYDQELITKLAEKSGFTAEYVKERSEYTEHAGWFSNAFSGRSLDGTSNQDYLWVIQRKILLELSEQESCVIVGRCADYVLRDHADCLRVFIHADMEKRADRIVRVYGETKDAPKKRLREKDRRRAVYYQFYTDMEWGKAQNYHISLDSGTLGIDCCVELLTQLY